MAQKTKGPGATQCVIYARYSSLAQRDQSIEDQVAACERWASSHGLSVYDVYADRHISGTTDSRPAFQQMIQDAAHGAWATVVVYKVDRFARDKADAAIYRRKLRQLGVSVESAMEAIPDGPEGVILEGMLDAFAEYYSRNLSQNVKRGMYSNAEKRKVNGVNVLGYRTAEDGTYEIDPKTGPLIQELFSRRASGESLESITQWLGTSGVRTATGRKPTVHYTRNRLNDTRYLGIYRFGTVEIPDGMPRLIDEDLWDTTRTHHYRPTLESTYKLQGHVFDLETENPYTCEYGTSSANRKRYYYYSLKLENGKRHRISASTLESTVAEIVRSALSDKELAHQIAVDAVAMAEEEANGPATQAARNRLPEIDRETSRLVDSIAAGIPADIIQPKLEELRVERLDCERVLAGAKDVIPTVAELEETIRCRFIDHVLQYDDLCRVVSNVYIDRCGGYVMCSLAWGDSKASKLLKKGRTRRYTAGSNNDGWCPRHTSGRTIGVLTFGDCVLLRTPAPWVA